MGQIERRIHRTEGIMPVLRDGNTAFKRAVRAVIRADVTRQRLIEVHRENLGLRPSAQKLDIDWQTLRKRWEELGLEPNFKAGSPGRIPKPIGAEQMEILRHAHKEGFSVAKAARLSGVSRTRIPDAWEGMGLKPNIRRGGYPVVLSHETIAVLRKAHGKGLSAADTGKLVHYSGPQVRRRWGEMGLRSKLSPGGHSRLITNEQIIADLRDELTQIQIARKHDLDPRIIYTRVARLKPRLDKMGIDVPGSRAKPQVKAHEAPMASVPDLQASPA